MIKQMIGKNNMFLKKIKINTHCKSNFMYFVIFLSRVLFFSIPPLSSYICNFSPPLALVWQTFAYKNVSFLQRDEEEYYYRYQVTNIVLYVAIDQVCVIVYSSCIQYTYRESRYFIFALFIRPLLQSNEFIVLLPRLYITYYVQLCSFDSACL